MKKRRMIGQSIIYLEIEAENNYDFGYKMGHALKKEIQKRIKKNKEMYCRRSTKKHDFSELTQKARKFLPVIEKNFPNIAKEAKGMADGAEVNFDDLLVCICDEEIVDFGFTTHCTTVAIKTNEGKYLLGHNEDWFPEYRHKGLAMIKGRIKDHKFLCTAYIGSLAGSVGGINDKGVAYSDTSFYFSKFEYKVPRSVHLRALLDVKKPIEAFEVLNKQGSIVSNTVFIFDKHGIVDIEELWNKEKVYKPKNWLIHTNHPLMKKYRTIAQKKNERESVRRYDEAKRTILKEKELTINTIMKILSDHKQDICGHLHKRFSKDITVTLAAFIFNPKEKWIMVSPTNPCRKKFEKIYL